MPTDSTKVYDIVEQVPVWGSCGALTGQEAETCTYEQLAKHVVSETKYPKKRKKADWQSVRGMRRHHHVAISRGVHPLLDEEAIRVVISSQDSNTAFNEH